MVTCYLYDDNLSHIQSVVNYKIIESLKENLGELAVTRGKKQTFIRMNIAIPEDKKVEV